MPQPSLFDDSEEPLPPSVNLPARPEDLGFDIARRAYANTSFSPDERARSDQQSYADDVNGLYEEMLELAKAEGQKALLEEEIQRYKAGYLEKFTAYLHSHSRTASPMITGPANFPVRQMQKRNQWADNKRDEFLEWRKRARIAIREKILDARPEEMKADDRWQALAKDIKGSLEEIQAIDEAGSPFTRSSFVNSIAGKVERLAQTGEVELVDRALEMVREYNAAHKKPAISERHAFWKLEEVAREKVKTHDAAVSKEPEVIAQKEGVEIIANHQADRVQIVFASKPDSVMIGALKKEGWHWSRMEGAWQRKLTEAAKYSAKKITGLNG